MESFARKLGLVETFMTLAHELGGGLIVNIIYIEGKINKYFIQQSLKLVQQCHPMLQVYIVESDNGFYFESEGITEIPLQIIYKKDDNETIKIAEKELHTKFKKGKNPLCRLTLLYSHKYENNCEIIVTFHHGIVDGISCIRFIDDLIFYYQKIANSEKISKVEPLQLLPPAEKIINYNIINQNKIKTPEYKIKNNTKQPQLIIEKKVSVNERFTRMLPRKLSQEKTKRLIEKCKEKKITVHSAICAAMLFATAKLVSIDKKINLSYGFPVNLRKYCIPEIRYQNIGCFISGLSFIQQVEKKTFFWDLAKECKFKIHDALINGIHINLLKQGELSEEKSLSFKRDRMLKSRLKQENNMGRNNIFSISNIGKFDLVYKDNMPKIKELYFAIGHHVRGDCFWLGVMTLNKQLFCNFIYVEPLVSKQKAHLLANDVIEFLEQACINQNLTLTM